MSYESLERELARRQSRRQSRRSKGDKKAKRNFNPYRRKGRKGSKARTQLAEGEDKLGKALAAARERAKKFSKSRLNITKLPPRSQKTLQDYEAEGSDAIIVEGHKPKRVESYKGSVALFYIGATAEHHYNHPLSPYQERTLLPNGTPGSIINPKGLTIEDVDEVMRHRTGAPWSGEYVLWSLEDGGTWADSSQSRMYTFDSEEFRADPAVYIKCFECEKPGYSDEMTKIAFGYLCARCARPEIDWASYGAEYESLNGTHRGILTYLSQFNPELVHRKYGVPAGMTQREIGKAVGTVRTNATKHLEDLIKLGLVVQIMRRPDGASRIAKVYLPTYEGRKIAESFRAEDLNGNGIIDTWETHAHENNLTGLAHEESFDAETFNAEKYYEEDPDYHYNPQFEPYDSFPTKDSAEHLYVKTKDFITTWSEGWDDYRTTNRENGGYFTSLNAVKKDANKEAKSYARKGFFPHYQTEDSSGIRFECQKSEDGKRTYNRAFNTYSDPKKDYTERVEIKYELIEKMGAESISLDIDGDGIIEPWELAQQGLLTNAMQEFNAPRKKSNPSEIREKAQEAFEGVTGWMWLSELTSKINSTLGPRQRMDSRIVSRAIGSSKGGQNGFYVTPDKRIFYYGGKDRGEFIKGVI